MTEQGQISTKSVLICGESGSGKSVSLMNIRNPEGVVYFNCEGGKPLPFNAKFKQVIVDDQLEILEYFEQLNQNKSGKFHTAIIDTASFMMDRFEAVHVHGAADGQRAWGEYGKFFRTLIYDAIGQSPLFVIVLGHLDGILNESTGIVEYKVPVKGALKKNGLEAYFTTVLNCKKMPLRKVEPFSENNTLLKITDRDRDLGYKHVFQTRTMKETVGDRIRTPIGMFKDEELFTNNDVQIIMDRLTKYYN